MRLTGGMAGILVRKVSAEDRAEIIAMINGTANLSAEERDCAAELLDIYLNKPRQKDYSFIAAAESGRVVGYACYGKRPLTDAVYDLYWILVHPRRRRGGIGAALLGHAEGLLKGLGARALVAETSGLDEYAAARSFYLKNGFTEEARVREFYKPGDDLVVFVKRMAPAQQAGRA